MEYRKLGRTNLNVSRMGIGGIPLQRFDEENAKEILLKAKELGVNFIDTARGYTVSEKLLGYALKNVGRDNFILATKGRGRSYEDIKLDIEASLKDLQTNYIDLYQCHCLSTIKDIDTVFSSNGALKALKEAKKEGKIGHYGFSAHLSEIAQKVMEYDEFETIQFAYNYVETQNKDILLKAKEMNLGTIIMKPVCGGAANNVDLSLRFNLLEESVDTVIPGVDNAKQLEENCRIIANEVKAFTKEEESIIKADKELLGNNFCRKCEYCMPCPVGISIPNIWLLEGYYSRYDLKDWAKDRYNALSVKGDSCIECKQCEEKCPYNLPICDMVKKTHLLLNK